MGQGISYIYNKCCFVLPSMSTVSGLLKYIYIYSPPVVLVLSVYKIMLVDSSTSSGMYLYYGRVLMSSSNTL
jgi:hypothetical protein